jgi:hypothetical protein
MAESFLDSQGLILRIVPEGPRSVPKPGDYDFMGPLLGPNNTRVAGLNDDVVAGDFSPVKFQGDRVYALVPSNGGAGPNRWTRMNYVESTPSTHGNSLASQNSTHVYAIRASDSNGETFVWKIGESGQGVRASDGASIRAEQQVRDLSREYPDLYFESEIRQWFPDKASARSYETPFIEKFRAIYGQDALPGNKTNR